MRGRVDVEGEFFEVGGIEGCGSGGGGSITTVLPRSVVPCSVEFDETAVSRVIAVCAGKSLTAGVSEVDSSFLAKASSDPICRIGATCRSISRSNLSGLLPILVRRVRRSTALVHCNSQSGNSTPHNK